MKARNRIILTALSGSYILTVAVLFGHTPTRAFNLLLVAVEVPLVWLIWAFARWSAYQHARRWARDIEKVHGPQVVQPARRRAGVR